jgi:beta-glucosidase
LDDYAPRKGMTPAEIAVTIDRILAEATLAEKVGMMSGKGFFKAFREDGGRFGARPYRAGGGIERLGVPAFWFTDGPRGVARGNSTCFPCTMARGASFDPDLELRIGQAMGIEVRAQGCNLSGAVCINLLRHPGWGRAQETYGEDPHHLGVMGAALGRGLQAHNVCATVKHFALNSLENARFTVNVRVDERTLHEVYLPHFKTVLDAGVASVMSAYNQVNGEYCGQDRVLLTDVLRGEWGFTGFVHSDWIKGVYQPYGAAAGLDVENPEPLVFGDKLIAAVEGGAIEPAVIDRACRRILTTLYRFAAAEDPLPDYPARLVACADHRALALEAAEKSAVLLANDGTLPFAAHKIRRLAVLGRLAALENTGDNGSSRVRPPYVVTALQGLQNLLGDDAVIHAEESDPAGVQAALAAADAVVIVAGLTAEEEGEFIPGGLTLGQDQAQSRHNRPDLGGDRRDLRLPSEQVALINIASAAGKPLVVVIVAGSAVLVEEWHGRAGAIVQTFYPGMEGGTALSRLLFGLVSPGGKLPFTVARSAADYPPFDPDAQLADYGYWHGYSLFDRTGIEPRYAFGHGLSYTAFAYRAVSARHAGAVIEVSVAVRNTGAAAGDEVVQVYIGTPGQAAERAIKVLAGFQRVTLVPDETRIVRITVPLAHLRWRDPATHAWRLEPGSYRVQAGGSSAALIETCLIL